jgi:hypothetical protein
MMPFDPVSFARFSQERYQERLASALKHNRVPEYTADPQPRRSARRASGARAALRTALALVLFQAH